ncbi:MAG: hypothetical protein V2A67_06155, partial [Bacteroidota bacterium]
MKRILVLFSLFFSISWQDISAQHINEHLCSDYSPDTLNFKKLFLEIENTDFLSNNEYFNKICDGYTLIGFGLSPTVSYYFTPRLKVEGGFYLLVYFGLPDYAGLAPVLRIQYALSRHLELVFGRIFGTVNHRLIEPLFGFDRFYSDPVENGMQLLFKSDRFRSDLWIDWQRFILPHSTFQEELTAGTSNQVHLLNPASDWQLYVLLQGLIFHKGGQVNDLDGIYASSILNMAGGLGTAKRIHKGFLLNLYWDNYLVTYNELSRPNQAYRSGLGYYSTFTLSSVYGFLQFGYWNADRFIAPLGDPLYQSISLRI